MWCALIQVIDIKSWPVEVRLPNKGDKKTSHEFKKKRKQKNPQTKKHTTKKKKTQIF